MSLPGFTFDSGEEWDEGVTFDDIFIAPVPLNQPAPENEIIYYFTDLFTFDILGELPLTGVTFSLTLNASGPFNGTLHVEDPRVAQLDWIGITQPNKNGVFVSINGTLVYAGIVQTRRYNMASQTVQIGASDWWSYFSQRTQAFDYTTTWATTPAGAAQIAETIIAEAIGYAANSLTMALPEPAATPAAYQLTASYPLSQEQTINSIVTQLQEMGYLVGFDFAIDTYWYGPYPYPQLTLSYPRRGRIAGTTGLAIDLTDAIDFEYDEDGTGQADVVYELATASGGLGATGIWAPAMTVDGYPTLEAVESHMAISSVTTTETDITGTSTMLNALAAGDLALHAYPLVAPEVTVPLFGTETGSPSIGDWIVGDDIQITAPTNEGDMPGPIPRFPNGLDYYFRITNADVTIADEGLSTVKLTLNMPPSSTPMRPPQ